VDRDKAIACFLDHVEHLTRLPLISDQEMKELFGDEVESALVELDSLNRENKICQDCSNNCCQKYDCEFYAPQLGWCPVFDLRPTICRLHFCERFQPAAAPIIKELAEIFISSIAAAAKKGISKSDYFDIPPFGDAAPQLITAISPLVQAVKEGKLDQDSCRRKIGAEAAKHRTLY
jgi:hypothetical protein